jgi:broad specificity phosphatase PhoE
MTFTLLLARHGHTTKSEPEQYLGQRIEAPLSERGRREAQQLADRLAGVPIDRIVSSPLARTVETARVVAAGRSVAVETDDRLKELDYGAWEGLTVDEINTRFPGEFALYDADPASHHVGGGESGADVADRLGHVVRELLAWWQVTRSDRTVLMVGHSSTNRVLLASLLGAPLRDYRRRFETDWASLTVLRWRDLADGPLLLLANDVSHLRDAAGATWD